MLSFYSTETNELIEAGLVFAGGVLLVVGMVIIPFYRHAVGMSATAAETVASIVRRETRPSLASASSAVESIARLPRSFVTFRRG